MEELLYDLYYNKHNYDGAETLFKKAKEINNNIKRDEVKEWLKRQATNQMNYSTVKIKKQLPIYSEIPNSYQIDLTFLTKYKKQNNNYYVLFTAIGINTRYAYIDYSTNKNAETILKMFKTFYEKFNKEIEHITGDLGSEFTNKSFINFLNDNKISYNFFKSDSSKLGIINRFHRTLKNKLTKYMTASENVKWIDVIENIVDNYNNTYNRGIDAKPIEVFKNPLLENLIVNEKKDITRLLKSDDVVFHENEKIRVLNNKKMFEDKMKPKYSYEKYTVKKIKNNVLEVVDENGKNHTFKKYRVLKISDNTENYKKPEQIIKAVKENKIIRLLKKEDLIDEPKESRTRIQPKKIYFVKK